MVAPNRIRDFFSRVGYAGPDDCWPWLGNCFENGYGRFPLKGVIHKTHRLMWLLAYGPIAPGFFICHHCDNPVCCNPGHLFHGLPRDNNADMVAKGRARPGVRNRPTGDRHGSRTKPESIPRGENHYAARLTADTVRSIRDDYAKKRMTQTELARKHGLTQAYVSAIVRRKKWRSV